MKRRLSIGLAVVLLLAVAAVIVWGRDGDENTAQGTDLTTVRGVIGSEKLAFFSDNGSRTRSRSTG